MIASDRKYIDPTPVLTSIVDDYGNELPIGDQKDIG
jgi:ubiquitin carboxyl-terminal hydrolase 25/28